MPIIFKKPTISVKIVGFLKILSEIQQVGWKHSQKINHDVHFTSYLSTAFTKILPHLKTIKNTKKLSVFGENDSRRLSNFLQTQIFRNFNHISTISNQINYRNIWLPKVIIFLIVTAQVLFFDIFSEKDRHVNAIEWKMLQKLLLVYLLAASGICTWSKPIKAREINLSTSFPFLNSFLILKRNSTAATGVVL